MSYRYYLAALALASCAIGAGRITISQTQDSGAIDAAAMRKDIETMRRVIDRALSGKKPASRDPYGYVYAKGALVNALTAWGSEAYYNPAIGFIYITSVDIPVAAADDVKKDNDKKKERTLWDEARDEVDGKATGRFRGIVVEVAADPKAVEEYKEKAMKAVAAYGANIAQMRDDQHLTVILKGRGARTLTRSLRAAIEPAPSDEDSNKDNDPKVTDPNAATWRGDLAADGVDTALFYLSDTELRGKTILTMSARRGDCKSFAAGDLTFEDFMKRVAIAQY